MAYKSCAAQIAANIQQDCERPLVGGYTGRAVIIRANDFARAEVVVSADNPREIMSIVFAPDADVKTYYIDNAFTTPFSGSSTAGNSDSGRNAYQKTLAIRVPMRGADVSRDVIEPLVKSADGFVVIAEKRDKVGDGSYEVIGYQNSLRGDIASVTRDESANGGDWLVNLVTVETWAEVTLVGSTGTYESAKKEFENLFGYERLETHFVLTEGQNQVLLSANGLIVVESIQGGEKVRETYSALNNTYVTINADNGTEVVIYGAVTVINYISNDGYITGTQDLFTSLDVSKNVALNYLNCYGCTGLTSLDLSKNTALTNLCCGGCTGLTSLDLSKNIALNYLDCYGCTGLTSLDLSKNVALNYLNCYGCTELTSLDLSKNTALTDLNCGGCTGLTSLDLSKKIALNYLNCYGCTGLTSLDLSNNVALNYLDCGDCTELTSLDLSKNTALTDLNCGGCTGLTSLDLSKKIALNYLNCYGCTELTSLDLSNNVALNYLDCGDCTGLTSLDLSKNTALTNLYCAGCTGLTSLDLSKNIALTDLDCGGCIGLMLLDIQHTQELSGGTILDQSMANLTTLQVAGTSAWAYEQVESWLSDYAPNDGKLYVDENTPQGVITEAEAKNWEVIYQS